MKKVVLLAPLPPPYGGIAVWTKRMLNAKFLQGWKIVVVDKKVIGKRSVFGKRTKRNLFDEIKRSCNIWKKLICSLRDREVKVVHICIPAGIGSIAREIISAIIVRIFKRKLIVHFRCTLPNMILGTFHLWLFKVLISFCDELFILNNKSADFLRMIGSEKKFEVIPNFINESEINVCRACVEKISTILYVGGVIPEKGCDLIIEVAKKFPYIQFKLIGAIGMDVPDLPSNVLLLGEQNQQYVHEELLKADLFMFLSRFRGEGFSNALAEAMASGLPCIVSDWAANGDMIDDGKGGIVLRESSVDTVVNAVNFLIPQAVRQNCADYNIKKVKLEYLENVIINRYICCYERLIGA